MVLNNTVHARTFVYCSAFFGPHETVHYFNGGSGFYHQYIYILHGKGTVEYRNAADGSIVYQETRDLGGELLELSKFENMYKTTITTDDPIASVQFNPVPTTRKLKVEILREGVHYIEVTTHDLTVVCITGKCVVNNKPLKALQYARVGNNKTVCLVIGLHDIAATVVSYS